MPPPSPRSSPLRAAIVAVSVGALALLVVLTWQVAAAGPLFRADERIGDAMRTATPPAAPPVGFAELLADLGNMAVALPVAAAAVGWSLLRTRRWLPALCYALALAAVPLLVTLLKAWLDRPGPVDGIGYYPSGHAATAAVAFCGAALLLSPACHPPGRPPRSTVAYRALPAAAVLLTALNGAGLVWRGYHWPADVLASWCIGWLLLVAATAAARRTVRGSGQDPSAAPGGA